MYHYKQLATNSTRLHVAVLFCTLIKSSILTRTVLHSQMGNSIACCEGFLRNNGLVDLLHVTIIL